jgi:hypothetical protein
MDVKVRAVYSSVGLLQTQSSYQIVYLVVTLILPDHLLIDYSITQ